MSSSMKGGFTTLNRWFGKKQKDNKNGVQGSGTTNGRLTKSTTNLHHLSTDSGMHINETSQLEYNRITPLPVVTSNAPFEQTFRITVLLPKDQLYVARLGARVPLSKLLSLVCDNKQLDADKYEFRSPVDASQVYSCESTIGAVGLSEIRLCHKSESYDSFNADSMLKFQRTGAVRDSLSSSSDFSSSRNSKLTTKTPSPYSSSNSLNSMDSTGMNYTRTPVLLPKTLVAPPRKKRVAPRPPSQLVIPEQSVAPEPLSTPTPAEPAYAVIVKRPQLFVSTPNLASPNGLDCNGNSAKSPDSIDGGSHYATLEIKRNSSCGLPEPTPRKRLLQVKKKTAPAPPPDAAQADNISLASTTASISELATPTMLEPPQPAPRVNTPTSMLQEAQLQPPPLPASAAPVIDTAPLTHINNNHSSNSNNNNNVSKVLLNRTPTPEPRSLSSAGDINAEDLSDTSGDKQVDAVPAVPAEPAEPIGSPTSQLDSLCSSKSAIESSSDDDEAVKVYNFKLCKTSVKAESVQQNSIRVETPEKPTTLAELTILTAAAEESSPSELNTPISQTVSNTPNSEHTSLSSWNYSVPISPPPDFSDQQQEQPKSCAQPKSLPLQVESPRPKSAAGSPLDEIVDELSAIISAQRLETLIRKQPAGDDEIEAAKPNKLANFSIASISCSSVTTTSQAKVKTQTQRCSVTRADSFQASDSAAATPSNGLGLRSASHLSLTKIEQNGLGANQRRSSSELSIGESPSLQSLEVIKTILSSRKNSLVDSASGSSSAAASPSESAAPAAKPKSSSPAGSAATPANANGTAAAAAPAAPLQNGVSQATAPAAAAVAASKIAEPAPVAEKPASPVSYRYTGPPSINFATWSERPKSQVAIKNEGDYIFGGKQAVQAAQRTQQPATTASNSTGNAAAAMPVKLTIEAAVPTLRMGIPLRDYKVPITVKPLRDASQERESAPPLQPLPQQQSLPATLPRPTKSNQYTLPAAAAAQPATNSASLPRPMSMLEKRAALPAEPAPAAAAPFGQNTLRRTGFKERMLAKEQQEKEQALRVSMPATLAPKPTPVAKPTSIAAAAPAAAPLPAAKPVNTVIKSSKLQLKLQQPTAVKPALQTPAAPQLQIKLRSTVQSAPASAGTPAPPPPPMSPALPTFKLRSVSSMTSASPTPSPTAADPRSQLLDAIRNFKREELNRA